MEIPQYSGEDRRPGPQAYQPNGSNMGANMGQAARRGVAVASTAAAVRAGRNHYALTQDVGHATWVGADAGRRWGNWMTAWGYTIILGLIGLFSMTVVNDPTYTNPDPTENPMTGPMGLLHSVPIQIAILLVIYNRNIDYSLMKRRFLYWIIKPFQVLLIWLPTPVLYLGLIGLPFVLGNL